ncbi:hypothetical protein HFN06_06065 [Rhizobium leguminosarum]|uniref:hypothetical protein n=1 Tax=Rhizobium TaxID=379 RepID=UPI00144224BF|nr:hypothetical protein [Rhizobium leguminosarum]MCA2431009.1 hypothetical protein [Rhizobium leguminosarum]NKK09139.1 hypothetical protein [Rhizobium leguminosarum bv. viciae]
MKEKRNRIRQVQEYMIGEWYRFLTDLEIFYDFFIGDLIAPWTEGKSTSVANELRKLQASALDRISTAFFTVGLAGVLAPSFKSVLGLNDTTESGLQLFPPDGPVGDSGINWTAIGFFTVAGIMLHLWSELLILEMKEAKK